MKKAVKYIISLAIALILLYASFRGVNWDDFFYDLSHCDWRFIAMAMAGSIAAFFFRSERWRCLLKPIDPAMDALSTFNGVNIGYLANFLFPRLGEFVRCGFIARRSRAKHPDQPDKIASFEKTFGTVLMSRSWDIAIVFLLAAVLVAARWHLFGNFFMHTLWKPFSERLTFNRWWSIVAIAAVIALTVVLVLILRNKSKVIGKIHDFCKGIANGFISWAAMKDKWKFFVLTVLLWGAYWFMSWCIVRSMPSLDSLGAVDALFVCIVGSFAWMVPAPGGFGAYHYIVMLALSTIYLLPDSAGRMCATLNHESQAITMLLCGVISYIIETVRK